MTFQPQTHSKNTRLYEGVPGVVLNGGDPTVNQNRIRAKLKEKHQRIAMERRQREMKELDECTFHPKTNPCVQDNKQEVVIVKGLGRHLELQELKKKQTEEKRLREAEVFGINHKFAVNAADYDINNPQRHYLLQTSINTGMNVQMMGQGAPSATFPRPFNLSSNEEFGKIKK